MKKMLKQILMICLKELEHIFHDDGLVLIMIIGAIMYSLFYVIPYYTETVKDASIGIIDNDNSKFSRMYIRDLDATDSIKVTQKFQNMEEANQKFANGEIKAFIIIPKDFEKNIISSERTFVSIYTDSSYLITYKYIYGAIVETSTQLSAQIAVKNMLLHGVNKKQALALQMPIDFVPQPLFNTSGGYLGYVYPMVLLLILQQTMILGIGMLEGTRKESNKYCEVLTENPDILIIGRGLAYFLIYLSHSILFLFAFPNFFGYNLYFDFFSIVPVLVIYLISIVFFAQTLNYFFMKREESLLMIVAVSLPCIFMPGLIWPKSSMPWLLNIFNSFIPSTNGIEAIIKINQTNATIGQVSMNVCILCILIVFYYIFARQNAKKFLSKHIQK